MKIITFNTERQYSSKGQRIVCTELKDGRIMFADVDRNIDGITASEFHSALLLELTYSERQVEKMLREFVMTEYDHGRITYGACVPSDSKLDQAELDSTMEQLKQAARGI